MRHTCYLTVFSRAQVKINQLVNQFHDVLILSLQTALQEKAKCHTHVALRAEKVL